MIVNFSHEEIELPKTTVLGITEETSTSIVAELNDEIKTNSKHSSKFNCGVNTVIEEAIFEQYLQEKLEHLTHKERSVLEPVLRKHRHIFHLKRVTTSKALIW
jgi:DNA-directed RNA polymerase specialized sigma subunit